MIPNKLEPTPETGMVELGDKLNQIIDYLSDKEASKGESKEYRLSICLVCGVEYPVPKNMMAGAFCDDCRKKNPLGNSPPQQEESRGECDCVDGYRKYFPRLKGYKCPHKPQLKEESPKEDDWYDCIYRAVVSRDYGYVKSYIKANFVSKVKIKKWTDRLRLECDVAVCDCGEKVADWDISDTVNDMKKDLGLEEL